MFPESRPVTATQKTKCNCCGDKKDTRPTQTQALPERNRYLGENDRNIDVYYDEEEDDYQRRLRLIRQGNQLLERDHKKLMTDYGKYSLYDTNYKNWRIKGKPKTPIWADKTFKSLGSGFWDLPFNKDERWKKRERMRDTKEKRTYVAEATKRKGVIEAAEKVQDPFISTYYPNRRTTQSYLTEYLREYHQMPLQREADD